MLEYLLQRKSIRRYEKRDPSEETINEIVRAGQQAPFAAQLYSILLSRKGRHPFGAPLLFTICADLHKLDIMMEKRKWEVVTNDLSLLLFAIQDGILAAGQMVTAGETLGLGSCFLGGAPYQAEKIIEEYNLPPRVFPIVQLIMGYPAENPPPRPRYPIDFVLFEDKYPEFAEEQITRAMQVMDEGYLKENYYERRTGLINLEVDREETFTYDNYSWTEHISRKWGQWLKDEEEIMSKLRACGFKIGKSSG